MEENKICKCCYSKSGGEGEGVCLCVCACARVCEGGVHGMLEGEGSRQTLISPFVFRPSHSERFFKERQKLLKKCYNEPQN